MSRTAARRIGIGWVAVAPALLIAVSAVPPVQAADPSYALQIENHRFQPETVEVPAGTAFRLVVHNKDLTPEEFESHELKREKVIAGGSTRTILIGPLEPGTYPFFGEFHEDTARGRIVAK